MGCDGGTIPKRDELVKVKKRPEAKDKQAELSFQWKCCVVTQEALLPPIVTCGLGRLYNKSSVIEGLLNRALLPQSAAYIKSLKDIKDLNLTPNPEYQMSATTQDMLDSTASPFICPVTGLEMSGKFRFVCLWSCGCVFSERAIKEIDTKVCPKCQVPYSPLDIVVLNGSEEDLELMERNMKERQATLKSKKKLKKSEATATATLTSASTSSLASDADSVKEDEVTSTITKLPDTATNNTLQKQKRPADGANNVLIDPDIKKIKTNYSVAKDPKSTDVYKSLFTSHKSEKQQTRAHWVTYNPFYN